MSAFSDIDRTHMAHALRLAEQGLYTTHPNPRVGCVIARGARTLGAGWHNNHHAFPQYASTRLTRWQIDVTGMLIALLERLGLVWDVQHPDRDAVRERLANARRDDA